MSAPDIEKLYTEQIRSLPRAAQLALLARIATDLAATSEARPTERSIMELHGLGAERWRDVPVDAYVNALRDEWDTTTE